MSILIKNTFFSTLTTILQSLTNILILVLMARPLGTEEFGRLLLAYSFASIFGILMEFGFKWYATKEVSQDPAAARAIAGRVLNAQLYLGAAATVLVMVFMKLLGYPGETRLIIGILWLSTIFLTLTHTLRSIFRGLNRFQYETWLNSILLASMTLLLGLATLFRLGTAGFALAILGARAAHFIFGFCLFKSRVGRIPFHVDPVLARKLVTTTASLGIQIVLSRVLLELNTIVLHQFSGNQGVGIFQAALRFILAIYLLNEIFIQAFFPVMAHAFRSDRHKFMKISMFLNRILFTLGAYIAGLIFTFADVLVRLAYGGSFHASVAVLKTLSFTALLLSVSSLHSAILVACDKQDLRVKTSAAALVLNVFSAFVLIPLWGAPGAAASMVATYFLLTLIYLEFTRKTIGQLLFDRMCLTSAAWVVCGGLLAVAARSIHLLLAAAVYSLAGVMLFWTATGADERKELLQALGARRAGPRSADPI